VTERLQVQIPELTRTAPRIQWLLDYSGQVALAGSQVWWSNDVRMVFQRLEDGFESVHKDYKKKRLVKFLFVYLTCGDFWPVSFCLAFPFQIKWNMFLQVTNRQAFYWLHCLANICDVQFFYSYQYLGNTPRLVITPSLAGQYLNLTLCSCPVQP
uniref:Uncharacterized protein n=1 Tax=Oncorhynchus kisutch TaxID=8019 RepID=A0A8C7KWJ8_ONCKI